MGESKTHHVPSVLLLLPFFVVAIIVIYMIIVMKIIETIILAITLKIYIFSCSVNKSPFSTGSLLSYYFLFLLTSLRVFSV